MLGLGANLANASTLVTAAAAFTDDYSVVLDGINDHVDLGSPFQSTFRGSWSASWWINFDDQTPSSHEFMFGAKTDANNHFYVGLLGSGGSAGNWFWYTKMNGVVGENTNVASGFSGNSASGWKHVVITTINQGGTNKPIKKMYIDGSLIATETSGSIDGDDQDAFVATQNIYVGAWNSEGSAGNYVTGKMNDVAIWSVALDDDAVTAIYNSGSPTDLTTNSGNYDNSGNLVGYWKFEENTGTTASDSAGSSDGSLENGASYDSDTP